MFGICSLFPAILGLTDTSGPIRPHVPIRYQGQPAARFARTYANEERPACHRLRRALERIDACRLGMASAFSVRDLRGDLVFAGYATPGSVSIQRELAYRLVRRTALAPLRKPASTPRGSTRLRIVRSERRAHPIKHARSSS